MNDEIDNKIRQIFSDNIELPYKYKNMIRNSLNKNKKGVDFMKNKTIKVIVTGCACLVITTAVVFAKDISSFVRNFFNTSEGIDTAIENGYILEPNMEYIVSEGTEAKIKNLLMDDYNLSFTAKLKFQENIDVNKIRNINLSDMMITDKDNKIIYCENKEKFESYCKAKGLNYNYKEFNDNYINSGSNWYIKNKNIENNEIELVYNLYANKFPKSKKLIIDFSKINISENEDVEKEEKILQGDWHIDIEIPEKFYKREAIVYTVKKCSDSTINIEEVCVNNTGTRFAFNTKVKAAYDEKDSEEVKKQKTEEFLDGFYEPERIDIKTVDNEYIELEDNRKFYPAEGNFEDSGTSYGADGSISHFQTFNLTKNDCTNFMTIKFTLNTVEESRDVIVELERKN